jgi:hypothetical protein
MASIQAVMGGEAPIGNSTLVRVGPAGNRPQRSWGGWRLLSPKAVKDYAFLRPVTPRYWRFPATSAANPTTTAKHPARNVRRTG